MKNQLYIFNAQIINEGQSYIGNILINDGIIQNIEKNKSPRQEILNDNNIKKIDAQNKILIPGVIDDQVHFREPGLTHKGDIYTESKAAIAGGITSFMEMPNTVPQATTINELNKKFEIAAKNSFANYSFYLGASNDNIEEIEKVNPEKVCGIKVFMGASTGNMLVDDPEALEQIFSRSKILVAVHSEDEGTIQNNIREYRKKYGEEVPIEAHPIIRSEEACYKTTQQAIELAKKYNTKLHVLHLSTAKELELFTSGKLENKNITAEVCIHHLWFNDQDYQKKGNFIKWNPAIKTVNDQQALFKGLLENQLDVIATDHAPHSLKEKQNSYFKAPSGGPLVQHSLLVMLDFYHQGKISLETIVKKMCHNPSTLFEISKRGYLREGYWADLVLIDLDKSLKVESSNILYKCGWSPFEDHTFNSTISHTIVNGNVVYEEGKVNEEFRGLPLKFNR